MGSIPDFMRHPGAAQPLAPQFVVPGSVPHDGLSDATPALAAWIASVPDGTAANPSTLNLNGGTFRIDSLLQLTSRNYLSFDLNGATIQWNTAADDSRRMLWFTTCTGCVVYNGTLLGTYTYPGTGDAFVSANQHMHAVCIDQSSVDVRQMSISGFYGDGVDYTNEAGTSATSSGHVTLCDIRKVGRNGVSAVCADRVLVDYTHLQQTGYWGIDVEPNVGQSAPCRNVIVDHCTWGGQGGTTTRRVFGVAAWAAISDVAFTNNQIVGRDASIWINYNGSVAISTTFRPQRLTFAGNTCDTTSGQNIWPMFSCDTIAANNDSIPVSAGTAVALHDVTGYTGNDPQTGV